MRKWLFLAVLLLSSAFIFAQTTVTGKITDVKTGSPIPGVSIKVKSSKKGTTTNNDGVFKIVVNPGEVLEISAIGYQSQSITVGSQTDLTIALLQSTADLGEVVVTGNRGMARVKTESPVPVDVIHLNSLEQTTAQPNLESQLNMAVPSFNYNKQSGADGADAMDFASLRGLGYDQTLVLVNGKRRHLSAFVSQFGTRGRGNGGTDLNAIPEAAIDRVEILRDGASAQYGSDAIAGVINIILKKDVNKFYGVVGVSGYNDNPYNTLYNVDPSQYYTGSKIDGKTIKVNLNYGTPIGKNGGFLNVGANFSSIAKTFRALPDTNWTTNPNSKNVAPWIAEYRRAFGDGSVTSGGAMYNLEIPIANTKTTFYSFGGYNYKHSNAYAWSRNFYDNPQKFPTNADGTLQFVPGIMHVWDPTPGGQLDTANVFYNPEEDVNITDISFAAGIKGTVGNNWDWDLSNVIGYNDMHYYGNNTFNATLPNAIGQTRFDDGGFNFLQNTTNLDLSKRFHTVMQGLTFSTGLEFRYENYKIYQGEDASWNGYPPAQKYYPNVDDTRDVASGSQGFPGFRPTDEVNANRTNLGVYAEGALDVTKAWLADGAVRYEYYSDFGNVLTFKFATRYKLTDNFNLRGSVSTGFRAPSLQQINFSNINTNIVDNQLQYIWQAPNTSAVAKAAGIPDLKQETSVNYSLGFAWKPVRNLTVTVDAYLIKMKNRIVLSGQFPADDAVLEPFIPHLTPPLNSVQFFANAVNTTNKGIDLVVEYNKRWGDKGIKLLFAGNIQNITIDKINIPPPLTTNYLDSQTFYSTREQAFLIASAPQSKFSLNLEYDVKQFAIGTHLTYYGKLSLQGYGYATKAGAADGEPGGAGISDAGKGYDPYVELDNGTGTVPENFYYGGKMTTDLYASYKITKNVSWVIGVDNIFNVHPNISATPGAKSGSWGDSESGGPFDAVQMGYNGMRLFTNVVLHF